MPRASAAQRVLPLGDQPEDICGWDQILSAAFADPNRTSGFLARAEEAVRKVPVKLLFPLVTCTLPAFALLTVAPLVAGALRQLRL